MRPLVSWVTPVAPSLQPATQSAAGARLDPSGKLSGLGKASESRELQRYAGTDPVLEGEEPGTFCDTLSRARGWRLQIGYLALAPARKRRTEAHPGIHSCIIHPFCKDVKHHPCARHGPRCWRHHRVGMDTGKSLISLLVNRKGQRGGSLWGRQVPGHCAPARQAQAQISVSSPFLAL